jgi:GMP synthase-like glutamine amidotransferase
LSSRPALILQHGEAGPPTRLGEWLSDRRLPFVVHRIWEEPPPAIDEFAFVASLGSQYSVTARDPSWIRWELDALRGAVRSGVPVLGLCFGGQALSVVLGGGVDVLARPEIGWIAVESVDGFDGSMPTGPWLQYHRELMRVPPGARELARSPAGPAAFTYGLHLGVQFHPEADAALADVWARRGDTMLAESGLTREQLAAQSARYAPAARAQAFALFDRWLTGALADQALGSSGARLTTIAASSNTARTSRRPPSAST